MLSLLIFLPLVFAIILLKVPGNFAKLFCEHIFFFSFWTKSISVICFLINPSDNLQFAENIPWIESFGISYFIGVDGISIWLLLLTTLLIPLVVLSSDSNKKSFYFHILAMETFVLGTFFSYGCFSLLYFLRGILDTNVFF